MAIRPLEQRLDSILPDQPLPQADPVSVDEMAAPTTAELADPPMEPVQVAGPLGSLRKIISGAPRRAGREVVPQPRGAAPDALPCIYSNFERLEC